MTVDTDVAAMPLKLLKSKKYVLFWISSLLSNMGTWMQQVAEPWIILSMTQSSVWVGFDSFAMNAPGWIFTLWGGVLADRRDRKKIILYFQGVQFVCVAALVTLLVLGWLKVWMIVFISFLVGLTDALSMPSFQSIIPSLVTADEIPKAVAYNSAQFNLSRVLGPAVAGLVIARFGAVACFGANAVSYLPFFLSLYWIYPKKAPKLKTEAPAQPISQIKEFKTFLIKNDIRIPLQTVIVTTLFCAPVLTFCPILIKDIFHSGVSGFGGAMAAFGLGGLSGAGISLLPIPNFLNRNQVSISVAILLGVATIAIGLNRSLFFLYVLLVIAGVALTVSNVAANSYLQENATNQTRGRVASLFQLANHGGLSIGALVTGFTVTRFGISQALILNGGFAIILQVFNFHLSRRISKVQKLKTSQTMHITKVL